MAFDTTRLVNQVVLKGALPDGRFTDNEILDLAYDSLLGEILPIVMAARQDYYVVSSDTAVGTTASFPVPYRAQNGVLREVKLVRGTQVIDLDRIKLDDVDSSVTGLPNSFYIEGNDVVLYPAPSADNGDILRLYYWIRPSRLVTVAECGIITAIVGNIITATTPATWTTTNTFDLVQGRAHFDILGTDLAATSVSSSSITLTATVPTRLVVGDYICLSQETCFPQLPPEGHIALVQCAVTAALEAMGDPAAAASAQKAAMLKESFTTVIKIRVEGAQILGKRLL